MEREERASGPPAPGQSGPRLAWQLPVTAQLGELLSLWYWPWPLADPSGAPQHVVSLGAPGHTSECFPGHVGKTGTSRREGRRVASLGPGLALLGAGVSGYDPQDPGHSSRRSGQGPSLGQLVCPGWRKHLPCSRGGPGRVLGPWWPGCPQHRPAVVMCIVEGFEGARGLWQFAQFRD